MDVLLLGTGAAAGWPNAFCSCPACAWAPRHGQVRGQTAALVDGRLLLDCGPEVPPAAARLGVAITGVRHLLATHGAYDHAGPMALLARSWAGRAGRAGRTETLDLVGPAPVLALFRDWTGPADAVRPVPIEAGDELTLDGYRVRALAAAHGDDMVGPGVLYDVTGPDDGRLLHATDTGPLPPATQDAVTGGATTWSCPRSRTATRRPRRPPSRPTTWTWPASPRRSLSCGPGTRSPRRRTWSPSTWAMRTRPGPSWTTGCTRLGRGPSRTAPGYGPAGRGAPAVEPWCSGALGPASRCMPSPCWQNTTGSPFATGGDRPDDGEWAVRVAAHRRRRPARWRPGDHRPGPAARGGGPGGRAARPLPRTLADGGPGRGRRLGRSRARRRRRGRPVRRPRVGLGLHPRNGRSVSNEVGSGVVPATASGRRFRDELGRLNARLAAAADEVTLVLAGLPVAVRTSANLSGAPRR